MVAWLRKKIPVPLNIFYCLWCLSLIVTLSKFVSETFMIIVLTPEFTMGLKFMFHSQQLEYHCKGCCYNEHDCVLGMW